METILTITISIIGSGAVFGFIQFIISRNDKKHDKQQEILDRLDKVSQRLDEQGARIARSNILRFEEELINNAIHSREYFRSILDDIDNYEEYCETHAGFKNSFTVEASAHIKKVYQKLVDEGAFKLKEA